MFFLFSFFSHFSIFLLFSFFFFFQSSDETPKPDKQSDIFKDFFADFAWTASSEQSLFRNCSVICCSFFLSRKIVLSFFLFVILQIFQFFLFSVFLSLVVFHIFSSFFPFFFSDAEH